MRIVRRSQIVYSLILAVLLGLGVGVISAIGTQTGWLPGVAVFAGALLIALRRPLRRWHATRSPLSDPAALWLERNIPLYAGLGPEAKVRFDTDVQIILDEWRFEAVGEVDSTEERRLGVAAGAALLLHGLPEWELPYRQTVLFYTDHFGDDYEIVSQGEFDGMAHQQGPIILSVGALDESWPGDPQSGNVVLHELAHLLDYKTEFADGVPSLIDARSADAWEDLIAREMDRIDRGESILRDYAATEPAEFFACAVESFFVEPELLEAHHGEVFGAMRSLFNLDPRTRGA